MDTPEDKKKRLKVLREADYVIGPTCGMCAHMDAYVHFNCHALHVELDTLHGRCKLFSPVAEPVEPENKRFLEKRAYTRSNRHKATPRY